MTGDFTMLAANLNFRIGIQVAGYPNETTLPSGTKFRINQVAVDYSRRRKQ